LTWTSKFEMLGNFDTLLSRDQLQWVGSSVVPVALDIGTMYVFD